MLVVIRGAGDIATGIALRLWRAHLQIVMTEIERPSAGPSAFPRPWSMARLPWRV